MNAAPVEPLSLRRLAIAGGTIAFTMLLIGAAWAVLAAGGWTVLEALILACLAANAPWVGLAATTALAGFGVRLFAADPLAMVLPELRGTAPDAPIVARTVVAVCVRLEDMQATLPALERLLRDLLAGPDADRFALAILSDTPDGPAATAEAAAVARVAGRHAPGAVRYRRRADNAGYKAGNVMDFLDHHGAGFEFMLLLDADSTMSADAVRRLVRVMQAAPRLAILQPTIAGGDAASGFAATFGFGHRHGARTWATGQAWWQGPQGAYWGHNALLRIAPFRAHCQLPTLPDGSAILSHDIVEMALLHAAGWAVRVLPDDTGSAERHPPDLPAMLDRDRRWAAGNMQYRHLLRRPELGRIGRLQMLQAMLHYALTPLWFALLPLAALSAATADAEHAPPGPLLLLLAAVFCLLHLPKLLGYAETLLRPGPDRRQDLLGRMLGELVFTILLDPLAALDRAAGTLGVAGRRSGWKPQRRQADGLCWRAGIRRFAPHSLVGLALALGFAQAGWFVAVAAMPAVLGMVLAVPFAVVTARSDAMRSIPSPPFVDAMQGR